MYTIREGDISALSDGTEVISVVEDWGSSTTDTATVTAGEVEVLFRFPSERDLDFAVG